MSDDLATLAKIRQQNRLRQLKFYNARKEQINEKRRAVYKSGVEAL